MVCFLDIFVRGKCARGRVGKGKECDGVPGLDKMEIRKV